MIAGKADAHGIDDDRLIAAIATIDATVLVLGDVMLDIYSYGQTSRISPEAPIPVMRLEREARMLGGAGNVARNLSALGGRVMLVGIAGEDASGDAILAAIDEDPAIESFILRSPHRRTTVKRRFVVGGQQMLRVDEEDPVALHTTEEADLIAAAERAMPHVAAVILSDYGKGVLSCSVTRRAIEIARRHEKPVLVDPKHADPRHYAGATTLTPNAPELARSTGLPVGDDEAVVSAARRMMQSTGAEFLIITRSADGLSLVPAEGEALHLPARRRDVFDVSGAGDTVVATFALAIGSGAAVPVAAALANIAAGVVVGKPGTATCSRDELELELVESALRLGAKLQSGRRAARLADQWRGTGLRVGFTNGCFDLLHPGHVSLLAEARARCDRLVVGLNSDASVKRLKGATRPLQVQAARAAVLSALASVDLVVIFEDDTPSDLIAQLRPDALFKGADYTLATVVGADLVQAYGGSVELIDLVPGQSTTSILGRMR